MLWNQGKIECVLKLSARDSLGTAGKRGLANVSRALYRGLSVHTDGKGINQRLGLL